MKIKFALASLLAVAAAGVSPSPAAPPKSAAKPSPMPPTVRKTPAPRASNRPDGLIPGEYMPTADVRAGMKGYGLSVFRGNKIERFDVTILGLLRKSNNGRDLILCKLSGPAMSRVSDIIAGMSGSPVYVNGRLLGAVSMGFQFTKEPIGMITPIEDMLDSWDPAIPQSPFEEPAKGVQPTAVLDAPLTIDGRRITRIAFGPADRSVAVAHNANTLVARPCLSPMSVAGVSKRRFPAVADALRKLGIDARDGVGTAMNPDLTPSPLTPGGAIAMSLVTGDLDMTAIGTLTYRRGDQIVAFGHPFLNIGPLDAPMFSAYIHDLLPSYSESQKLGSPVRMVGAFSQDRPFSVAGKLGALPALVPVTVRITDHMLGRDRLFHAGVVQHPQITPVLAPTAAATAIDNVHGFPGDAMATVETEVVADEVGTVRHTNRYYDGTAISDSATGDLQTLVALLTQNAFYPVTIRSVTLHVTIDRGRQTAQVERIFLKQTRFEPGDTVEVGVVLKPYKHDRIYRTLTVKIPPATPPGNLVLSVQGGPGSGGAIRFGGMTFLPSGGGSDYTFATNVTQIAHKFQERERNDDLIVRLALPTAAVSVGGERLSALPPNLDAAMRSTTRSSGVLLERDEVKTTQRTDYVLSGAQALTVRVVRHGAPPDGTPAPVAAPAGGVSGGSANGGSSGGVIPASPPPVGAVAGPHPPAPSPHVRSSLRGEGESYQFNLLALEEDAHNSQTPPLPVVRNERGERGQGGEGKHTFTESPISPSAPTTTTPPTVVTATDAADASPPLFPPTLVGRQPGVWHQATATDFRQGKMDGVTVTSAGEVRVAPRLTPVAQTIAPYFWSLAPGADGAIYAGSGDEGAIYRVGADGKATVWSKTGELEVQSLLRDFNGNLYAGTAPHGRIYRIYSDAKAKLYAEFDSRNDRYVLALAMSPDKTTLYAAIGGNVGRVYAISGFTDPTLADVEGQSPFAIHLSLPSSKLIYSGAESSVTALAVAPDGSVYAGTAPSGLILKVAGPGVVPGHPTVLYDTKEASISGLAVTLDGTLYAATAPHGTILRVSTNTATASGAAPTARVMYDRTPNGGGSLVGLVVGADGQLYTASGATMIALDPAIGTVRTFDAPSDIQILSLLRGANGAIWAGTGNTASVYRLDGAAAKTETAATDAASGRFVSSVLDTMTSARWGTIRWTGAAETGAKVTLETRTGSTPDPDATWSDWSRHYLAPAGEPIASPPARYLQYRATLAGSGATLSGVDVFYLTPNQAPQVTLLAPRGGETLRGTATVRWSGTDPDRDTLAYRLALSSDNGATWQAVNEPGTLTVHASAPTPAAPRPTSSTTVTTMLPASGGSTPNSAAADLAAELANHPELSPEMRARILADAPSATAGAGAGATLVTLAAPPLASAATPTSGTRGTDFALDTTAFRDGVYRLRVTATDRPSNPTGALTDEKVSPAFRIANHLPSVILFSRTAAFAADRTYHLEGIALHPTVAVRGVQFRVDGGAWMAAVAEDGIFDSASETFTIATAPLGAGSHTMEVQAVDEAGNAVVVRREVRQ